jgi:hypothetical protein
VLNSKTAMAVELKKLKTSVKTRLSIQNKISGFGWCQNVAKHNFTYLCMVSNTNDISE